mgnify:CR=1 FL=1
MVLSKYVVPRDDVFDHRLDEKLAPELYEVVLGIADRVYTDPDEFFSSTYITDSMRRIVNGVVKALCKEEGGYGVVALTSFFGGGKTHTMILLYHAIRNPEKAAKYGIITAEQAECLRKSGAKVVVFSGKDHRTAPSPIHGESIDRPNYSVKTIWGYIADSLGRYSVIEQYDKDPNNLISPDNDHVIELIKGLPILLLIDEVVHYLIRLRNKYSDYVEQVYAFFDILSSVAKLFRVSLVISIPGQTTSGLEQLSTDETYKDSEDIALALWRRIARNLSPEASIMPIATDVDLVNVLRKRLFKEIDEKGASEVIDLFSKLMNSFSDYLRSGLGQALRNNYPFHPTYLQVLRGIIEKSKSLQKTRDAIRISRVVVRKLWNSDLAKRRSLITASDIDVRDDNIRALIFKDFNKFDNIAQRIIRTTSGLGVRESESLLALHLASFILFSTYVYDPLATQCIDAFPSGKDVISSVDLKYFYEDAGLSPKDASELLERLVNGGPDVHIPHLMRGNCYGTDKYWFTAYPDPIERCRTASMNINDNDVDVINRVREYIQSLLHGERGKKTRQPVISRGRFFVDSQYSVMVSPKVIDVDQPRYMVVALFDVPSDDDIKRLAYSLPNGERSYKNTIVIVHAAKDGSVSIRKRILDDIKLLVACERERDNILREYREERDREYINSRIKDYESSLEKEVGNYLMNYFSKVSYPDRDGVSTVDIDRSGASLIEYVESTLKRNGKIPEEAHDFSYISYVLKENVGIDLENLSGEINVKYLVELFYREPKLPMLTKDEVIKALLDGVKGLYYGVKQGSAIYYRTVEGLPGTDPRGLTGLSDDAELVPWEKAVDEEINSLLGQERRESGTAGCSDGILEQYFVVQHEGKTYRLAELMKTRPDDYRLVFKLGTIKRVEECVKNSFELSVDNREFDVEPGSQIRINVDVGPVGEFNDNVTLNIDYGSISPVEDKPRFKAIWELTAPKDGGIYRYHVIGSSRNIVRSVEIVVRVKGAAETICVDNVGGLTSISDDYKLSDFELRDADFDAIQLVKIKPLIKSIGETRVEFVSGNTKVVLDVSNIDVDAFDQMIKNVRNILGRVNTQVFAEYVKFNVSGIAMGKIKELKLIETLSDAYSRRQFSMKMCFSK